MASKYEVQIDLANTNNSHALIVEFVGRGKRVLDVGCATGDLARVLVERGCAVTGTETDPEAAHQAEKHCERVVVGDVEEVDLSELLGDEAFDVIVFGDTLEHLKNPLQTLDRLKPFLRSEGYVVASIPNVAHGSVRLALIQGRFRYSQLGLLDKTHLRFFTRESVEQLFEDAGFLITGLKRTLRGVFDTEIEIEEALIPDEVVELVQADLESSTYQFVLAAHRFGEAGTSAKRAQLLAEELAQRDRVIYDLRRKLRSFEELQLLLDERTEQLAQKEGEVSRLAQEVADRNDRMARLVQFGKEDVR
jgi:2-polyprenyl-3-methyl-5-hydroxy-6-metoxy-1,4-benzoquinol methylase